MDERERRTDLRRRAIFTLAMIAAGSAFLAAQEEPAPRTAHRLPAPPQQPEPSFARIGAKERPLDPPRVRAGAGDSAAHLANAIQRNK